MLLNNLTSIIDVLDKFIDITKKDLDDIKNANHEILFSRNAQKETLVAEFVKYKSNIDRELQNRAKTKDISDLLDEYESEKLEEFKIKLSEFNLLHKQLTKLVFTISNFYTNMLNRVLSEDTITEYGKKVGGLNAFK